MRGGVAGVIGAACLPGGGYALPGLRRVRHGICRVAATPYPAYGECGMEFAGWRLRLTRPTASAAWNLPGGGCALPGLRGFVGPCKRSAAGLMMLTQEHGALQIERRLATN